MTELSPALQTFTSLHREHQPRNGIIAFLTTDALRRAWILSLGSAVYAVPVVLAPWRDDMAFPFEALLTFAVGMMLTIRVRSAYERWWEGRIQWGMLVNASRNVAVKLDAFGKLSNEERLEAQRAIAGFARALQFHLRGRAQLGWIRGYEESKDEPAHVPTYLSGRLYELCERLRATGRIGDGALMAIDEDARVLLNVCGACERIKNTPMLPSFPAFLRFAMVMLILSLPWRLAGEIGFWTVPSMVLGTFLIWGAESVAQAADNPFGRESDDLDLEAYCAGIDRVTAEVLQVNASERRSLA